MRGGLHWKRPDVMSDVIDTVYDVSHNVMAIFSKMVNWIWKRPDVMGHIV